MATQSLYDLAILDRADEYTGLVEDVTTLAPEFSTFSAHKRSGTWYKISKRTTLPTVQFRAVNTGIQPSKSGFKSEVKEMFFVDGRLQLDEAVWDGDPAKLGSLWQIEAKGAMQAASILIGVQTWYGTGSDTYGFTGCRAQIAQSVTTAAGASTTSAYLLWMDPAEGCRYDVGMDGQFSISPPFRQQVVDSGAYSFFAYVGNLKGWVGFNVMSNYSVFAALGIANSTAAANWMTDDKGAQLLAKIPVARRAGLRWFMNRTCESSLQRSRSTINVGIPLGIVTGANTAIASYQPADASGRPAFSPLPNNCVGYPITLTDCLLDTETNS